MAKMEKDNDFTFCQLGVPDLETIDSPKAIPDISSISIEDESPDQAKIYKSRVANESDDLTSNADLEKQEKVGSLKFKVVDVGSSVSKSQELKSGVKKPATRAKVPYQIGYSHMDWLKLTRTHPDLAGLKGQSNRRLISLSEVKQHQTEDSMWTVLKGRVYNIAPYMKFHPGGVDMLTKAVGKDCTALFNKYHAWVNEEFMLEKCLVGIFDDSKR